MAGGGWQVAFAAQRSPDAQGSVCVPHAAPWASRGAHTLCASHAAPGWHSGPSSVHASPTAGKGQQRLASHVRPSAQEPAPAQLWPSLPRAMHVDDGPQ